MPLGEVNDAARGRPAMTRRIVILGGGVMGSSLAFWLTREPGLAGEVVVVERDPAYRTASSALSASGIRQQFTQPVNIAMSRFGVAFLRDLAAHLGAHASDVGLTEGGYLYLATAGGRAGLEAANALQRAHGADVALLEPEALRRRFPWLTTEDVALGALGLSGEGWFDGYGLMRGLRQAAIAQGARYVTGEVAGSHGTGGLTRAVRLADGTAIEGRCFVIAGGPWSGHLGRLLEIALPVAARRRTVFVLQCPEPPTPCPLVIDPSGVWFRPEGRLFLAGCPPVTDDADDLPLEPEHDLFEAAVWPALAARCTAFERLKVVSAWAGYYEMNTVDRNGLVGAWPDRPEIFVLSGFSGHGVQQAPAAGRGLAELIAHGRFTTLDLEPLAPARLARGRPLVEHNVI